MALRQALVLLYCQARRFLHLAPAFAGRYLAEEGQKRVSLGHVSVCRRIVRVELDSLTVVVDALLQIEIIEVVVSTQVGLVRLGVRGPRGSRDLRLQDRHSKGLDDSTRKLILNLENVGQLTIVGLRPDVIAIVDANE